MMRILVFLSTSAVIRAENILLSEGIKAAAMPLPPSIRAGCGIALRVEDDELDKALAALEGKIQSKVTVVKWEGK